jgi:hypothetical protein
MHHSMFGGWLVLALGLLGLNCGAAGETTDDPVAVTEESLGYEDPAPAPGGVPGGGHDPGGPGSGWAGGWANDPQYAPYAGSSSADPNQGAAEAQRQAHDRENAPYRSHGGEYGGPLGRPYPMPPEQYAGGFRVPAPRPPAGGWARSPTKRGVKRSATTSSTTTWSIAADCPRTSGRGAEPKRRKSSRCVSANARANTPTRGSPKTIDTPRARGKLAEWSTFWRNAR